MSTECVVVTGVRSVTHLVHVASYLRYRVERDQDLRLDVGYVGGGTTLGDVVVGPDDVRRLLPQHPRVAVSFPVGDARWACDPDVPLTYVSVGAPGLKPWARLARSRRGPVRVVVTDEGLGTYGDWRTRRDAWRRQGVPEPWRSVRTAAVTTGIRLLTTQRWALYRDVGPCYEVVPEVAAEMWRHCAGTAPGSVAPERVVLLTQPWVGLGLVTASAYRAHVEQLAERVAGAGRELVVRPHPAESLEAYDGLPVLTTRGPAELDRQVLGSGAVLGGTSTALLNLAAVFGLPAVRVVAPGLEVLERDLGPQQRRLLDQLVGPAVPEQQLASALHRLTR